MRKLHIFAIALFTFSSAAFAQDRPLTIDDIFSPDLSKRVRFGGTPVAAVWAPDGRSFKQIVNGRLMRVDAATGQAVPYFDSGALAAALVKNGVKTDEAETIANSPALKFNGDEGGIVLNNASDLWYWDIGGAALRRLT